MGLSIANCHLVSAFRLPSTENKFSTPFQLRSSPIAEYPFYMLIETSGSSAAHDEEKLDRFLVNSMDEGRVCDGTVTNEPGKIRVSCMHCTAL